MAKSRSSIAVGLISDTHGLIRPGVHQALAGVALILHAGDVGGQDVLDELATIAPIHAVAGNTDPPGVAALQDEIVMILGGCSVHVSHGHELGSPTPEALLARYAEDVIVYGHTHRPLVYRAAQRLVVNPGAAGPRRFNLIPSVARLSISGTKWDAAIIELT